MKGMVFIVSLFSVLAVLTACSSSSKSEIIQKALPKDAPPQRESTASFANSPVSSQPEKIEAKIKEIALSPNLKSEMRFGDYMTMRIGETTIPERWQFSHGVLEQTVKEYRAFTVWLKATNISKGKNFPYDILRLDIIFHNQAGQKVLEDTAFVMLIGKWDLTKNQSESIDPGAVLVFRPFFWIPSDLFGQISGYTLTVDVSTGPREQEYLPQDSGPFPFPFLIGVYKETDSSKGKITAIYKASPFGESVFIKPIVLPEKLIKGFLRARWFDKSGKAAGSDNQQAFHEFLFPGQRRALMYSAGGSPVMVDSFKLFSGTASKEELNNLSSYEFWFEAEYQ